MFEDEDPVDCADATEGVDQPAGSVSEVDDKAGRWRKEAVFCPKQDIGDRQWHVTRECSDDLVQLHPYSLVGDSVVGNVDRDCPRYSLPSRPLWESDENADKSVSYKEYFYTGPVYCQIPGHEHQFEGNVDALDSARTTGSSEIIDDGSDVELDCLSEAEYYSAISTGTISPPCEENNKMDAVYDTAFGNPLFSDDIGTLAEQAVLPRLSQCVDVSQVAGAGLNAPQYVRWHPMDNPLFADADDVDVWKQDEKGEAQQLESELWGLGSVSKHTALLTQFVSIHKVAEALSTTKLTAGTNLCVGSDAGTMSKSRLMHVHENTSSSLAVTKWMVQ